MKIPIVHIIGFFLSLISFQAFSQEAKIQIREGNEAYKNNQFQEAEELYRQSLRKEPDRVESTFNLGDALYRQEKYEDASRYFNMAAEKASDKATKAKAYHNLGNSYLKEQKFEESINAYKKSLLNNPKDEDTRFNLAYAKQQLQQQQEQEQKQEEENQDKENKEEEEQENQQNKEQEQEQEEQSEEEQQQEQQEQNEQEEQQQQQPEQVSREDAERILEALNNKEKEIQEELKKKKVKQMDVNIEKDW